MRPLSDLVTALLGTALLSAFTWMVLKPTVGFDDANITQNYAQNIARGLGYVFYEGGERVEGSTSALWTAMNVVGYLITDTPEELFAGMGFAFTAAMILFTILIARSLLRMAGIEGGPVALIVAAFFALIPALYAWSVWSLMETGLWNAAAAGFLWAGVRFIEERSRTGGQGPVTALVLFAVLMVLIRPEGVALVAGGAAALLVIDRALLSHRTAGAPIGAAIAALAAFGALTFARLIYFGVPHPNTYYAKVSTDLKSELVLGWDYTWTYLNQPEHMVLGLFALLGVIAILRLPGTAERPGLWAVTLFFATVMLGTFAVYTVLGGDHFGSHRYYQVFLILTIPAGTLGILALGSVRALPRATLALGGLIAIGLQWSIFSITKGHLEIEFRLPERQRPAGAILNQLADRPTIGLYIAGGIPMTFDGVIYDMFGLNWTEMAHAERHDRWLQGGFSKDVFMSVTPDIVTPMNDECEMAWPEDHWINVALEQIYRDPDFLALYELDCWQGVSFFRHKDYQGIP